MPSMDYLFGEITVDGPEEREEAVKAGNTGWPEGWWAVSDEHNGYIGYFCFEHDACAFRMMLITARSVMPGVVARYAKEDAKTEADERDEEWVVGTEASNGTFYLGEDLKPVKDLDKAVGYGHKSDAENFAKHFKKPNTFVKKRRQCR